MSTGVSGPDIKRLASEAQEFVLAAFTEEYRNALIDGYREKLNAAIASECWEVAATYCEIISKLKKS